MSRKTWSPIKENQLMQHLAKLENSPSSEDLKMYGSQSSINEDPVVVDVPTEPKRRRLTAEDTPNSMSSQVSSQMSSRSHSPVLDDSLMSTPSASPSGTLKEHFRRKYRKDELWAAIETNYKYLMDKGIIEACQSQDTEAEAAPVNSNVSFGEFFKQYKEISDWLKNIQLELQQTAATTLELSKKYLNRSYYEEMERSPKLPLLNDYASQLIQCQPVLKDEVDVFMKEVNTHWTTVKTAVTPSNIHQDPQSLRNDLEADLECLKKWLDVIEENLRAQMSRAWSYEELESVLLEHKDQQRDIESHSRVVSAVLKLSDNLNDDDNDHESLKTAAHNLERRWHGIWLQSLEWQCRLEDALSRKKGIYNPAPFLDTFTSLRDYTTDEDDYDSHDVTSGGEDSLPGLGYRGDFIQSPQISDSSTSFTQDFDNQSGSGKDSAVASESEQKTSSDMSENYQDLSVSTSSDSDREFLRQIKIKKHDSRDIGYGSESQSDELEGRNKGIMFTGISGRGRNCGNYYATVAVDTESTDKTDGWNSTNEKQKSEESDINTQYQQVLQQDESEMEDIRYLIDQADIMVQQGNQFNKTYSPQRSLDKDNKALETNQESLSSSSSSGQSREMVDKGVGTIESSCDASDEESGESDAPIEDGTDAIDSVLASEYTSDEMRNGVRDYSRLPKLYDTNALKARVKGKNSRGERPWSVIELPNVQEGKCISECATDRVNAAYSDSDIPSNKSRQASKSLSPTFQRRARKVHRIVSKELTPPRSQIGAKRKLELHLTANSQCITSGNANDDKSVENANINPVNFNKISSNVVTNSMDTSTPVNSETKSFSGSVNVPCIESCTSEDELAVVQGKNGLISQLQSARFKSSGSSNEDSDNQGIEPGNVVSETDDPGNFSENAWDNYQAPLYPTGSEEPPEDALTWEPGEMEFDDEFSLPNSTIIATLMARRSDEDLFVGKHAQLMPSNQGNFEDSDSDAEDLNHVLEESRMQLKVADRSLKKKRKDPLKTGLYMNPGKYGELMATIETNIRCLEAISQHIDQAEFTDKDVQKIQDLLYQWEKLHALASERRNQSQEVKTMYATFMTIEGAVTEGVSQIEKKRFKSLDDLRNTVLEIQDRQKFLVCQRQMLSDVLVAMETFAAQNPSVNMLDFKAQIQEQQRKIDELLRSCMIRLGELEHVEGTWLEYMETRKDLECVITEERALLERLAYSQDVDADGNRLGVEADLKRVLENLCVYEEKLFALQKLRGELSDVIDEDVQTDLMAGIADIRNQIYVVQKQCQGKLMADLGKERLFEKDVEQDSGMEVEDRMEIDEEIVVPKIEPVVVQTKKTKLNQPKSTTAAKKKVVPKAVPQTPGWLKAFPLTALGFAVFLGLLYLFAPHLLHRLFDFSLRISPELNYVNGAPPV